MIHTTQFTDRLIHTTQYDAISDAGVCNTASAGLAMVTAFFKSQSFGISANSIFSGWCRDISGNGISGNALSGNALSGNDLSSRDGVTDAALRTVINRTNSTLNQSSVYLNSPKQSVKPLTSIKPLDEAPTRRSLESKTHRSREPRQLATVSI